MTASLYRMFDGGGSLLYVGCSASPSRFDGHRAQKAWWKEVFTIEIEHFDTRTAAIEAERAAISTESPRYNVQWARPQQRIGAARGFDRRDRRDRRGRSWIFNGVVVRALRERSGLNGAQFAIQCQLSPQHLSDIELGNRNPSPPVAARIAKALNVPVGALIGGAEVSS